MLYSTLVCENDECLMQKGEEGYSVVRIYEGECLERG